MANFGWVPFADTSWQLDVTMRGAGRKILPMADGGAPNTFGAAAAGQWNEIVANDSIMIAAHGRKWSTDNVAWLVNGQLVEWSANKLAQEMWLRLGGSRSSLALDYRLLACFGANRITPLAESFGERLAKEMKGFGMKGTLTAYRGATGILGNRGRQVGSSRITCAISMLRHGSVAKGRATDAEAKVWSLS